MDHKCTILASQVAVPRIRTIGDRERHVSSLAEKISQQLLRRQADLVVLPELCSVEYSRAAFEQLDRLAENLDGQSINIMQELARKHRTAVLFGMPRKQGDDYLISQIGLDQHGKMLCCYDKLHICQYGASMEKEFFQRGTGVGVFELSGFRFAPIICYDIRIPELARSLTIEHNVDCILHCGAYFRDASFASWHAFATTRAIENQIYLVSLNRAGADYGGSMFCPPWMDEDHPAEHFPKYAEDFKFLTLEKSVINQVREDYTFLRDRLDSY
ncbi:MAG: carbon-nitrogen hydrolase family protein [Gammaproteobacteria bacterium]|nr:carbon-nitrogen hydrolase family protein [Gammaproteobacteria bacterium]